MESNKSALTPQQYARLYTLAFARLADIAEQAERAMRDLEELQLSMGDGEKIFTETR